MSIDVEYAIKKDIRNNPVVREIDVEQKRDFARTLRLAVAVVGMLLFAALQQFRIVTTEMQLEQLRRELAVEEAMQRRWRLQVEMLLSPEVVERRATSELGMVAPPPSDVMVLERVVGGTPPRSVIADAR
jgi:hypothetical protein